ncbi:NAD(P)H-quinone oxidoreductase subunit T, chloroplastic [Marchantia polymorpha subsp. ruderalis]|uniref:J domain-containing protein n=3 Tax=Marchantia polymorpha TaxID=3197 RepID=A0AAF6AW75_MARPO|nr:hypothetical protein MARPO_0007s0106 [Marchantia polymorpha]BBN04009.1 hypothetical protein Mp_3g01120 [Marchantia polymorpha subsp. ruderalis]|eukprot:PTQ47697.1 hypothetical protein MARPO_0007s0106 [Marchantia polymorpha]
MTMLVRSASASVLLALPRAVSPKARPSTSVRTRCSGSGAGRDGGGPFVDTRIHWGSSEEGWVGTGGDPTDFSSDESAPDGGESVSTWRQGQDDAFMGLLFQAADSHYRYLGLTPDADTEDIKAAYRRLSKTYHPDTTALPLEVAAQKFVRLKEAYTVLSSEQERRFYDWQLAQEVSKRQGGRFIWPYEASGGRGDDRGPYSSEVWDPENDSKEPVDRLGGDNMELSDQAQAALLFDAFALVVSIFAIIFAALKQSQS